MSVMAFAFFPYTHFDYVTKEKIIAVFRLTNCTHPGGVEGILLIQDFVRSGCIEGIRFLKLFYEIHE